MLKTIFPIDLSSILALFDPFGSQALSHPQAPFSDADHSCFAHLPGLSKRPISPNIN